MTDRIQLRTAVRVNKCLHESVPVYLAELCIPLTDRSSRYRLRSSASRHVCVSDSLCLCLSVCTLHNPKTNDLKVFKLGKGNDMGYPTSGMVLGSKVKVTGSKSAKNILKAMEWMAWVCTYIEYPPSSLVCLVISYMYKSAAVVIRNKVALLHVCRWRFGFRISGWNGATARNANSCREILRLPWRVT